MLSSTVTLNALTLFIFSLHIGSIISIPVPSDNDIVSKGSPVSKCKRREYYHNETQSCYKHRVKGPCQGNMLFQKLDKIFGDCDCSVDEPVPWVYHAETNECWETYKQSYCSVGEWLIFDKNRKPICAPNPCKDESKNNDGDHPTILFNNKCLPVRKPSTDSCKASEEVGFSSWDVIPECISTIAEQSVIGTTQLRCRPGTKRDSNGTCRRTITVLTMED